jgi:hypothetical protein
VTVSSMPAAQARDENDPDPTRGRRTATDKRPHVRMTAGFFTRPGKLTHIADPVERMAALALLAASIGMCRELGTDGHIVPEAVLEATMLPPEYAKTLMTDDVWHQADHGCRRCPQPRQDHVYVHDYLLHNRTAEQEARTSERRRAAGQTGGESRWAGHEKTAPERRPVGRPRKDPDTDAVVTVQHPAEARARRRGRPAAPETFDPIIMQLCEELAEVVRRNGFSVGKIGASWWKPCDQLLRIGPPNAKKGVTPEQIRKAITWANEDGFWWKQIRSMENLREKYETLRADAQDPRRAKRGAVAVRPARQPAAPSTVTVPGMAAMLARQMGAPQVGMVKGA